MAKSKTKTTKSKRPQRPSRETRRRQWMQILFVSMGILLILSMILAMVKF